MSVGGGGGGGGGSDYYPKSTILYLNTLCFEHFLCSNWPN